MRQPGEETAAWLEAVLSDRRVRHRPVPRLRAEPCRPAVAIDGEKIRIVRDYEVEVLSERRAVAKAMRNPV